MQNVLTFSVRRIGARQIKHYTVKGLIQTSLFAGVWEILRLLNEAFINQKDRHERVCKHDDPQTFLDKFRKNE